MRISLKRLKELQIQSIEIEGKIPFKEKFLHSKEFQNLINDYLDLFQSYSNSTKWQELNVQNERKKAFQEGYLQGYKDCSEKSK